MTLMMMADSLGAMSVLMLHVVATQGTDVEQPT